MTKQADARPDGRGDMPLYTHTIPHSWIHAQQVLTEFAPDSHPVIEPVRVPVTLVMHYISSKFEVSTTFRVSGARHGTNRRTDGSDVTVCWLLWPIGGAATMHTRCWCFALCEDSDV